MLTKQMLGTNDAKSVFFSLIVRGRYFFTPSYKVYIPQNQRIGRVNNNVDKL